MKKLLTALCCTLIISLFMPAMTPIANSDVVGRSTVDRPDEVTGFQIHLIYVLLSGSKDDERDVDGSINTWVNDAQNWLQKTLGRKFKIDTYQGNVDVTFLQSKYRAEDLCAGSCNALKKLADEMRQTDPSISASKTLFFNIGENLEKNTCGWAGIGSNLALDFYGDSRCNDPRSIAQTGLSDPSKIFIHEIIHSFGVHHVCSDDSDILIGTPECTVNYKTFGYVPVTIDSNHKNYVGSEAAGVDILKMPVWSDGFGSATYATALSTNGTKYFPKLENGQVFAVVGKTTEKFDWSWSKNIDRYFQNVSCKMTAGNQSINGNVDGNGCRFNVPATWRPGTEFEISQQYQVGPFSGHAAADGVLVRPDYTGGSCTQYTCYEGGNAEIHTACWSQNVNQLSLQQLVDGKWQSVTTTKLAPVVACSTKNPLNGKVSIPFSKAGTYVYRWYYPGSSNSRSFADNPFPVIVVPADQPEPSDSDVMKAKADALTAGSKADALVVATPKMYSFNCAQGKFVKRLVSSKVVCPRNYKLVK